VSLYHLLELFLSENESFRHCLAEPRQPRKKKHSLHFWFGGGESFLEKGKDIFLWCSALEVSGQVAEQCGRSFGKTILRGEKVWDTFARPFELVLKPKGVQLL